MARCRSSGDYRDNCELPNSFLSTTYTLNRSNTKSISTGLRYDDGEFRHVVQIPSSHNPVTFDSMGWGNFKEQFEIVVNYFHNQQQFNRDIRKPIKLSLPLHDLTLDSRFGTKAEIIDERVTVRSKIGSTSPTLGALHPGALPLARPSALKPGALTAVALTLGALTPTALTPGAMTPAALTPGALTPGARTPGTLAPATPISPS
ncbi:hypothetical protein QAD02_008158 [Eretmocerus hayati]|uniref:Uncharacterized protein n=1 Tax=Eretmocerus hayati TaxID=131215 RepID=A0ACC2N6I3_9HYME|nr:hypothetical protein QAD02_008158 [Eretmocerus hayati]